MYTCPTACTYTQCTVQYGRSQQDIGFGDPTPPPVHQPPSFYAAAQAVSAFHTPQSSGGYPPPAGGGYPPPAGQ